MADDNDDERIDFDASLAVPPPPLERPRSAQATRTRMYSRDDSLSGSRNRDGTTDSPEPPPAIGAAGTSGGLSSSMRSIMAIPRGRIARAGSLPVTSSVAPPASQRGAHQSRLSRLLKHLSVVRDEVAVPDDVAARQPLRRPEERSFVLRREQQQPSSAPPPSTAALRVGLGLDGDAQQPPASARPASRHKPLHLCIGLWGPSRLVHQARELSSAASKTTASAVPPASKSTGVDFSCLFVSENELALEFAPGHNASSETIPVVDWHDDGTGTTAPAAAASVAAAPPPPPPPIASASSARLFSTTARGGALRRALSGATANNSSSSSTNNNKSAAPTNKMDL